MDLSKHNPLNWDIKNEADKTQIEEANKKEYEVNHLFHKTFSTDSGKKVLEWLILHTLESPTWWPSQPKEFGYFREGQNSLIRQIKDKIEKAKNYQEKKK